MKQKKWKKPNISLLIGALTGCLLFTATAMWGLHHILSEKHSQKEHLDSKQVTEETTDKGLTMPYVLESGLVIDTCFQYTGINPDCKEKEGVDIASIQITNSSGKYIKEAAIEMILDESQSVSFLIQDLPQDAVIYAFDVNNSSCSGSAVATDVTEHVEFANKNTVQADAFDISYDDMTVQLVNRSKQTIESTKIIYHDQMDGILFGGISYQKTIDHIAVGESITIETPECYFGGAQIVGFEN